MTSRIRSAPVLALGLALAPIGLSGCAIAHLIGGMAQNAEHQKLVETPAEYASFENKRCAVVVDVPAEIAYQHPTLVAQLTGGVSLVMQQNVPDVTMIHPDEIIQWQWRTFDWASMPYGEIAQKLGVDRVVHIDIFEYRLNPPGNSWLWEGVCSANVSIIEADFPDPDMFADTFAITTKFPDVQGVDRDSASETAIERGLLQSFVKETVWLFYDHLEPKYPQYYRPELDPRNQ